MNRVRSLMRRPSSWTQVFCIAAVTATWDDSIVASHWDKGRHENLVFEDQQPQLRATSWKLRVRKGVVFFSGKPQRLHSVTTMTTCHPSVITSAVPAAWPFNRNRHGSSSTRMIMLPLSGYKATSKRENEKPSLFIFIDVQYNICKYGKKKFFGA